MYRRYKKVVRLNGQYFLRVWIDPHYEEKHKDSMSDELIFELLAALSDHAVPIADKKNGFTYFEVTLLFEDKTYRLILVVPDGNSFVGVRNAYRRS